VSVTGGVRQRLRVHVRGAVQGVGFRPFVYRLATGLGLFGWVLNSSSGVVIEVDGDAAKLEEFLLRVASERPPRAVIQGIESAFLDAGGFTTFEIRESEGGEKTALVLPDIATCDDCLRELRDPADRRYRYPFTNCTNCGPRFTIVEALPYDRPNTTMVGFRMCEACAAEYREPRDRRFHAQPNACPVCGPHLELWDAAGRCVATRDEALERAEAGILAGEIVAVKGLGGFHLMVDARNDEAVRRLRRAKAREEKPFALMVPSLDHARAVCEVNEREARLLSAPEAPIVLLRRIAEGPSTLRQAQGRPEPGRGATRAARSGQAGVAEAVAPGNPYLGIMLPYTPLHHLLLGDLGVPVVATSGNRSDEPICTDERDAVSRLGGLADAFLVHDRPIARHVDDSIVRLAAGRELVLRRARGYAPLPVTLGPRPTATESVRSSDQTRDDGQAVTMSDLPPVLAVGAHLKNTVALAVGANVFVSQHIGDLETPEAYQAFERVIGAFERMYAAGSPVIACDAHPDYLSTRYATGRGLPVQRVQHHLAHVLGCMAENEVVPPALGVAWDGTGFGLDGTVWGGEFFAIAPGRCERVATFAPFALPGGELAVREPRRAAMGVLDAAFGEAAWEMDDLAPVSSFERAERRVLRVMLSRGVNAPRTSSAGRLFDAVAALAGIRQRVRYEGQAAMELEFALEDAGTDESYPLPLATGGEPRHLDWIPMIRAIVEDVRSGCGAGLVSARFHNAMAASIVAVAGFVGLERVVLSGGCFQNRYLLERTVTGLARAGFRPTWPQRVPPNDGGIALGQVVAVRWGIG
jgi:hydrogenase maturation protein HypF